MLWDITDHNTGLGGGAIFCSYVHKIYRNGPASKILVKTVSGVVLQLKKNLNQKLYIVLAKYILVFVSPFNLHITV